MATLREWVSRLWGTVRPRRDDRELEQELRLHVELAAEDARRRGLAPERALREAQITTLGRPRKLPSSTNASRGTFSATDRRSAVT